MTHPSIPEKPAKQQQPDMDSDSDESDDEDYAPDEKDFQSEGDEEDSSDDDDNTGDVSMSPDSLSTTRSGMRRTGGDSGSIAQKKHKTDEQTPQEQAKELEKKSRLDALWAEMNAPVSRPAFSERRLDAAALSGKISSEKGVISGGSPGKMITITTTYEFAGEMVTVTKDVPEDSKEAKEYALKNKNGGALPAASEAADSKESVSATTTEKVLEQDLDTKATPTSNTEGSENISLQESSSLSTSAIAPGGPKITTRPSMLDALATKTKAPVRYIRKKSQLDELAATYGVKKPPKLNTLEKSKLDWKNFVGKEGIEDELKRHNKDGYMEKVAFLQRTDERRDQEYQQLKKKRR
ncbi:swr complex subunit [Linnemannia zychae]|nr:swr complex subunit [Linnemannia zychae]